MGEPMLILNSVKDAEEIVCCNCVAYWGQQTNMVVTSWASALLTSLPADP